MTYSIIVRDKKTWEIWAWVQSHWYTVSNCIRIDAGIWAIITQAEANNQYGKQGLKMLEKQETPKNILENVTKVDSEKETRQCGILNAKWETIWFTGTSCLSYASHIAEENLCVQANMMAQSWVPEAMKKYVDTHSHEPMKERILWSLKAAQKVGGDIRGMQSAHMIVVSGKIGDTPLINVRVDDHPSPLQELKRLTNNHTAYQALESGECKKAIKILPDNIEVQFWYAIGLEKEWKKDEAGKIFKRIFKKEPQWEELKKRVLY